MKKSVAGALALALMILTAPAFAANVVLVAHNLRSSAGVLSTLVWKSCPGGPYTAPCLNPGNAWVQANGVTGSSVTWDWDSATGILRATGRYETATFISSNPSGSSILADRAVNLVIDAGAGITTATSYECIEGTFVASVGSNACGNFSLGDNFTRESTIAYNVGNDATCVNRVLSGDDYSTGTVRGITTRGAGGGCDTTAGAFALWTIEQDDDVDGGTLILSNGLCLTCPNVSYMTFRYEGAPDPVGGVANPDSATVLNTAPININILGNDSGFSDPVTVTIATAPAHGTAAITGSPGAMTGVYATYTAAAGYQGTDSFTYSISDGVTTRTATVTVTVASGLPSSPFVGDWPTYQGNAAHTGYVAGNLNPAQFGLRWQIQAASSQALNPVAVGDGRVFVSAPAYFGSTGLFAYDLKSGTPAWEVGYSGLYSVNPPAYDSGRVYLQTGKGTGNSSQPMLRAYEADSGDVAFLAPFGAQWEDYRAPTIVDGTAYINGGAYGGMYAFDATEGVQRWFNSSLAQEDGWTPAVDGTYAYSYLGGVLTAVNRASGATAFSINGAAAYDVAVPVLGGSNDAIVVSGGQLIRLNLANRSLAWQKSGSFAGQPAVAKGVIYAISSGTLSVRDQGTGNVLWSWSPTPSDTLAGEVLVTDTHVLVGSNSKTYAVNLATRVSDWSYPAGGSLALANYTLLIASRSSSTLTAIRVGPPGAFDDEALAYRSTPATLDVLRNDDGFVDPTTLTIAAEPAHGTVEVTGSPGDPSTLRIVYTPEEGYTGPDSFQYQADSGQLSDVATVTLDVRVPLAVADTAETRRDTPVNVDVLKNDLGFTDPVTVTISTPPAVGAAQILNSPGDAAGVRLRYVPPTGFSGNVTLKYEVTSGTNSATGDVTITVLPYLAKDDSYHVLNNTYTYMTVGTNDVGFQNPLTISIVSGPDKGSAYVYSSPGNKDSVRIEYYATGGTYDTSLVYQITDGVSTDRATVTIHVVPYIAQDDQATTSRNTAVLVSVTRNDLGFGSPRTLGIYSNPLHGTATVSGGSSSEPTINYTPNPGFLGTDTFDYAIDDGAKVGVATVTVRVINDADGDLVDDGMDNCLNLANADQRDADGDGFGNLCDGDFNNDGRVNFADLAWFRARFATANPVADLNGSGLVNFADLSRFTQLFGKPPGPSALVP